MDCAHSSIATYIESPSTHYPYKSGGNSVSNYFETNLLHVYSICKQHKKIIVKLHEQKKLEAIVKSPQQQYKTYNFPDQGLQYWLKKLLKILKLHYFHRTIINGKKESVDKNTIPHYRCIRTSNQKNFILNKQTKNHIINNKFILSALQSFNVTLSLKKSLSFKRIPTSILKSSRQNQSHSLEKLHIKSNT